MDLDTIRRIDRYAGVPLCALASLLVRTRSPAAAAALPAPRRALVLQLSEMGSLVLSDPALRKLAAATGAELHFAVFEKHRAVLDLLGTVPPSQVFGIRDESAGRLAADTLRFARWARRRRIDAVLDLELFSRYSALLAALSGAGRRVGFHAFGAEGLYRGSLLTHRVAYNPHQHMARNFVALVNALLAPEPELPYSKARVADGEIAPARVAPDAAGVARMRERIRAALPGYRSGEHRLVLLHAAGGPLLLQRRWPPERFAELAVLLLGRYPGVRLLLTGSAGERAELERLAARIGDARCANFAGETAVADLPALFAEAAVLVANDSGLPHLAAVSDLPVVVLFGPETPDLYLPLGNAVPVWSRLACSPCVSAANHRSTPCADNRCLTGIGAAEVLELIRARFGPRLETPAAGDAG